MNEALEQFKQHLADIDPYEQACSLLYWDLQTQTPPKGVENKLNAVGVLSTEVFKRNTSPEYGQILKALAEPAVFQTLDAPMQVTVTRYLRDYEQNQRIPQAFYTEIVTAQGRSQKAWEEAKRADDFSLFLPHLEKLISMTKQQVSYTHPGQDPFDALIGQYEEGMDSATIDRIFAELKEGLLLLLAKIQASPQPDTSVLEGQYDVAAQKRLEKFLLEYIGFDFSAGTTGESEHPFTMGLCPTDIRVTNHFSSTEPVNAMFSAIHEGGHAIFEQNIDPALHRTAAGQVNLLALHESQSRFFENMLGRNKNFWSPIYGQVCEILPQLSRVDLDTFWRLINYVHPSFIRTEADEVTYCLHVILRYEIEKAIFREDVPAKELPALWNDKMEELLGIRPASDAQGILQDMHWSGGSFGYFPTYLLGSIYDGMILQAAQRQLGDLDALLAQGQVRKITAWLNENIHRHGSLYLSQEVLRRLGCGEISAKPLLDYFEEKYAQIYGF